MELSPPAARLHHRRSNSALPKLSISTHAPDSITDHKKGHLSRHSLHHHHHLQYPYRKHGKDSPGFGSLNGISSNLSRQTTRAAEYAASSGGDSKPQSLRALEREDGTAVVKIRPEVLNKERHKRELRDKYEFQSPTDCRR